MALAQKALTRPSPRRFILAGAAALVLAPDRTETTTATASDVKLYEAVAAFRRAHKAFLMVVDDSICDEQTRALAAVLAIQPSTIPGFHAQLMVMKAELQVGCFHEQQISKLIENGLAVLQRNVVTAEEARI